TSVNMATTKIPIQSTAGAITLKNKKGELTTEKVKVNRYVTGKRPEYAPDSSSEEEEEQFAFERTTAPSKEIETTEGDISDRRLRRLQEREQYESDDDDRVARHRREVVEPEVVDQMSEDERERRYRKDEEESSEEEEEIDDEEFERRRNLLRQRAKQKREDEEVMDVEEEKSDGESEEESSEYEEYTDSEEEVGPRLKPVFVRKRDRITIQEKEREEIKQRELEVENKKLAEDRRRQTLKMVENEAKKEFEALKATQDACDAMNSEGENDEEEYEAWKVREFKRLKRNRDEREAYEKEKLEVERIRNMTEEERLAERRANPKMVVNKGAKGKYKFLQKYYHRGAFYMDEDKDVLKRDYSAPTLEDHFDKTILPKVMQVKNFGRSGRTKYTHLLDQDTSQFDSPWMADTVQNMKFHSSKGGGMKQNFDRPSNRKK
ncbi:hypothetical protein LOTGIDRAFT_138500, partial [Lottia gigantea]